MEIKNVAEEILKYNKIAITFHTSPDGDAIGSSLGLLNVLRNIGKTAYITSRDVIPDNLSFLPCGNEITGEVEISEDTELVVVLDCGNTDRISADLENYNGKIINIDHHMSNENYGYINYIESDSAACAEIVYLLAKELGFNFEKDIKESIEVGMCIYTGILTDTGSFRHSNVTKRTHYIAGSLIDIGVKNNEIHSLIFENRPYEKIKLIGATMNNLELLCDNKVAYVEVSIDLLKSLGFENVDTSDIISMALSIAGVEVAVLTKEAEDGVKASLRSKNDIDVRKIAEALGGGGHVKAAGLKIKDVTLTKAKEIIINQVKKEL